MKTKKKAILISCFNYIDLRVDNFKQSMENNGYSTKYFVSNFDHINKVHFHSENYNLIKVPIYKRNFSISRIVSHIVFSYKTYRMLHKEKPDLIYSIIPPNSLVYFVNKYARKYGGKVKTIIDIYDLWPETLSNFDKLIRNMLFSPIFKFWKKLRDNNIRESNIVFTECDAFSEYLSIEDISHTIYLSKPHISINLSNVENDIDDETINFCYLGSINSAIDISTTVRFLSEFNKLKKVCLHIIGGGERERELIKILNDSSIEYISYGIIFDSKIIRNVMSKCDFGLNIYNSNQIIGLTMKSIEYFRYSLPIINTVKFDTEKLVENYTSGYNLNGNYKEVISKILALSRSDFTELKKNAFCLFSKEFEKSVIYNKINLILKGRIYGEDSNGKNT